MVDAAEVSVRTARNGLGDLLQQIGRYGGGIRITNRGRAVATLVPLGQEHIHAKEIGVRAARARFADLLNRVAVHGETIVLTYRGHRAGAISPVAEDRHWGGLDIPAPP